MISARLKNIFIISVFIFLVHLMEEWFWHLAEMDPLYVSVFGNFFSRLSAPQAMLIAIMVMWVLLMIISLMLISSIKWQLAAMSFFALVFLFECFHIYEAFEKPGYVPGLISAIIYPVLSYFYIKELIKNYQLIKR